MTEIKLPFVVKASFQAKYVIQTEDTFHTEMAHRCWQMQKDAPVKKSTRRIKLRVSRKELKIAPRGVFSEVQKQVIPMGNISRFFVFQSAQNVLILGVQDEENKYVLIIRLKNERILNRVCDVIEACKGNTLRHISQSEIEPVVVKKNSSPPIGASLDLALHPKMEIDFSPRAEVQLDPVQVEVHIVEDIPKEKNSVQVYSVPQQRAPSPAPRTKEVHKNNKNHNHHHHHHHKSRPPVEIVYASDNNDFVCNNPDCRKKTHDGHCDEWEVSELNMQWTPERGSQVVENGPIYMYVAHQKHPHYSAVFTCETDSGEESDSSFSGPSSSSSSSSASSVRKVEYKGTNERRVSRQYPATGTLEGGYVNGAFTAAEVDVNMGSVRGGTSRSVHSTRAPVGPGIYANEDRFSIGGTGRSVHSTKNAVGGFGAQVSIGGTGRSIHSTRIPEDGVGTFNTSYTPDNQSVHSGGIRVGGSIGGTGHSIHSTRGGGGVYANDGGFEAQMNYGGTGRSIHSGIGAQASLGGTGRSIHSTRDGGGVYANVDGAGYDAQMNYGGTGRSIHSGIGAQASIGGGTGRSIHSTRGDANFNQANFEQQSVHSGRQSGQMSYGGTGASIHSTARDNRDMGSIHSGQNVSAQQPVGFEANIGGNGQGVTGEFGYTGF